MDIKTVCTIIGTIVSLCTFIGGSIAFCVIKFNDIFHIQQSVLSMETKINELISEQHKNSTAIAVIQAKCELYEKMDG